MEGAALGSAAGEAAAAAAPAAAAAAPAVADTAAAVAPTASGISSAASTLTPAAAQYAAAANAGQVIGGAPSAATVQAADALAKSGTTLGQTGNALTSAWSKMTPAQRGQLIQSIGGQFQKGMASGGQGGGQGRINNQIPSPDSFRTASSNVQFGAPPSPQPENKQQGAMALPGMYQGASQGYGYYPGYGVA